MKGLLSKTSFLASIQLGYRHLRLKAEDKWTTAECRIKFESFVSSFPECSDEQFIWAMEQWIQSTDSASFLRLPTWDELMRPLYQTVGGKPSRVLGFREDLPETVVPTAQQLLMLPEPPPPPQVAADPPQRTALAPDNPSLQDLWAGYLEGEFDPFPPVPEEGSTAQSCRLLNLKPATVERSLLGGTGSVRSWNGGYDRAWRFEPEGRFMVTFPRRFFLEQHPRFRDLDFRDMEAFNSLPYGGSGMVSRMLSQ